MDTHIIKTGTAHVYFTPASRRFRVGVAPSASRRLEIRNGPFHEKAGPGPHPMYSYQWPFQERQARAADLLAEAEHGDLTVFISSQYRPGSRRPSRPRSCGSANRCHWCSTSSPRRVPRHGFASAARQKNRRELRRAGDGRRLRIIGGRLISAVLLPCPAPALHGRRRGLYAAGRRAFLTATRKSAAGIRSSSNRGHAGSRAWCAGG